MKLLQWLKPKAHVETAEVQRGMRMLLVDGACGQVMLVLTTGAFLVGFALLLGASNKLIGLLAAVGPLSLTLQIPAVYLIERTRRRKALVVGSIFLSRGVWLLIAALPWLVPRPLVLPIFFAGLLVHFGMGSIGGCAFNSWFRDLIPEYALSGYLAKRLALATAIGALLSFGGGYALDLYKQHLGDALPAYAGLFALAGFIGSVGVVFLARTPEPEMPPVTGATIWEMLLQPLRDTNFRQLFIFLGWWSFAVNFAAPFFAVYLIQRLNFGMTWVLGLGVLSQCINVVCFGLWGRMADRFSNKSVLLLTGPWFIFSFLLWPFTTMPDPYVLTIPILLLIHALAGVSTAGVNLCAGNLALKIAPYGKAGAYLAVNALVSGLAATIAPILAGFAADWFAAEQVTLTIRLAPSEAHSEILFPAVDLHGLDFVFAIAFLIGLYSIHRLLAVKEKGEVKEDIVAQAFIGEITRSFRQVSTVAGVRQLIGFPLSMVRRIRKKREGGPLTDTW